MMTQPFDILPLWGILLAAVAILSLAMEAGFRSGQWWGSRTRDEREQPVGAIVASILGLVALVLGFTFSLAASRFDSRRLAVLEESNAIGTTWLRARLLPEPERTETARLLREYVDVRVEAVQDGNIDEAIARSESLQDVLWSRAASAAEKDPHSIMTGLFVESLNEVIDLHAKRVMVGIRSRIPLVIWIGLVGMAILGMASMGYQLGLAATRRSPAMWALVMAFAVVLYLIADLDRAHAGLLRVSQQSLLDLQNTMQGAAS